MPAWGQYDHFVGEGSYRVLLLVGSCQIIQYSDCLIFIVYHAHTHAHMHTRACVHECACVRVFWLVLQSSDELTSVLVLNL